jgi:Protein of unknown function (DUF3732)
MHFQVRKVILWPRNRALQVRIVPFKSGTVNVITGASQTGKSAIVPIIDYCLGAGKCSIPTGVIRLNTDWFGVVVDTGRGQLLLARREPGAQQSTSEMFMMEDSKEVAVPDHIATRNTNREFVKSYLDELAGLTTLHFDPDSESGFKGRPSFRDMAAFNFQPQNIIANPEVLFFKADTFEHREKLRTIFPYVLGVLTPEIMAKRFRLDELRREERSIARQLETMRQSAEKLLAELHVYLSRAREFGLLPPETPRDVGQDEALRLLRRVAQTPQSQITAAGFGSISQELVDLRHRESELSLELTQVRQRWMEMNRLRDAATEYRRALQTQEERLGISRWLLEEADLHASCPVCGSSMDKTHSHLQELVTSLNEVEGAQTVFRTLPPTFDREFARVRSRIANLTQQIGGVQLRIRALQEASENERQRRYTEMNMSRFVGKIESELAMFDRYNADDQLRSRRDEILSEIAALSKEVDEASLRENKERAIDRLSTLSSSLLTDLGVENPQDPIKLSTEDLNLKVQRLEREDWLSEIGSGSNWVGYHLAISLGLHRYFMQLQSSPVPSFLVFDQPSQVFFPKKLAGVTGNLDPALEDDDVARVRKLFDVISRVTTEQTHKLQTIVLDHAAGNVWGDIAGVNLVEEWRGSKKLIPQSWLE